MSQIADLTIAYIREAVLGVPAAPDTAEPLSAQTAAKIIKLAARHSLAHLLFEPMKARGLDKLDFALYEKLRVEQRAAIYRSVKQRYVLDCTRKVFEKHQIPFCPLKGAVMCELYPAAWMRFGCDLDILIRPQDKQEAARLLCEEGDCGVLWENAHEISFSTPENEHIELHYHLIEDGYANGASALLDRIWEHLVPVSDESAEQVMPDEWFHYYHIAHMAKHMETGGCGVRALLDLYLLNKRPGDDATKGVELLEKGNLLVFAQKMGYLSKCWFSYDLPPKDDLTLQLEKYVLYGGAYGDKKNTVAVQAAKQGKWRYMKSLFFIDRQKMEYLYPRLREKRWMLPAYYVHRWGRILRQGKGADSVRQLKMVATTDKNQAIDNAEFLRRIGLM